MGRLQHSVKNLPRSRKIVLIGSLLALFSIFLPWHTIGTSVLGTDHTFNGFGDQNLAIGVITFVFMLASLLLVILPLLSIQPPRTRWSDSALFLFFGSESLLLLFVLTVMHSTSIARASSYDLRAGLQLTLVGAVLVILGGHIMRIENRAKNQGSIEPLARPPHQARRDTQNHLDLSNNADINPEEIEKIKKEDSRMRLDI